MATYGTLNEIDSMANVSGLHGSFAEGMSKEDAQKYLDFLENGSKEGLTEAEIRGIGKVDEALALKKVNPEELLELRKQQLGNVGESGRKTNFDNEIPRSGAEWNEYLKEKYGADNVHWNINSVDDIFRDPTRLKGYTADELQKVLGNDWTRGVYGSNGGGWKLMNGDVSIFYHPGGGKHGGSYYGISSGATGKIKVVNPETYIPLKGDRATIIYD